MSKDPLRSHPYESRPPIERMPPFFVMELLEKAAALEEQGRRVIHLEVGEPDFDTPEIIREAGIRALREGHTHYTHSLGHPRLREAIAEWYSRRYGVRCEADQVVVTMGSSAALLLVFAALLEPTDKVLMPDPHYACYPKFVTTLGGEPVFVPLLEEEGYRLSAERLSEAARGGGRAVIINSPSNPLGTVLGASDLRGVADLLGERMALISDEVYHGLVYEGRAPSLLEFSPQAIVVNGFSKLFAMTGWRLGYALLPRQLVRPVQKLQQNLFVSPADFVQMAALAALTQAQDEVERMRQAYDRRRHLVLDLLQEMGLSSPVRPTGAFYVFINVSRYTRDVLDFSLRLLEEEGVAVAPGIDFGRRGAGFIRISYANSTANLEEGLLRLKAFLDRQEVRAE